MLKVRNHWLPLIIALPTLAVGTWAHAFTRGDRLRHTASSKSELVSKSLNVVSLTTVTGRNSAECSYREMNWYWNSTYALACGFVPVFRYHSPPLVSYRYRPSPIVSYRYRPLPQYIVDYGATARKGAQSVISVAY
jgi:hypothetical protein